ncbi:DUF4097 family beta strand repeat-containing protein [Legionella sp. CNM-4043-24]|uniref:DUF4097 family beta strand repeat-containing protein n=1 Tax=Legionella sp. CNM-4043-24 TaxID=3421646 RepID=UPI00403A9EC7
MTLTIGAIKENEHFEYKGDVHITGSIGAGARVIIQDGSLIIDGDVGERSDISLTPTQSTVVVSSVSFYSHSSGSIVSMGGSGRELRIHGSVGKNAHIKTTSNEINIDGYIGSNTTLKTMSGDIKAKFVHDNASLNTMSGDIHVENVGSGARLNTMSGDIHAIDVGYNSLLKTMSGDVKVCKAHPSASLETISGSIYENGVIRRKELHGTTPVSVVGGVSSSVFIGGLSLFGSVGRVVVGGQDVTHLLGDTSRSSSSVPSSEPVRYQFR